MADPCRSCSLLAFVPLARFGRRGGLEPTLGVAGPVEGQVAVVDFEGQDRQRGLEEPAGGPAPAVGSGLKRIPAPAGAGVVLDLGLDQELADVRVPLLPVLVLQVVQELGGVIPVVDVPLAVTLQMGGDPSGALDQRRVIARPAQELTADQGLGRHDR